MSTSKSSESSDRTSSTCTCQTHPERHCLRHPTLSGLRHPTPSGELVSGDLKNWVTPAVPPFVEPESITHLRKLIGMTQIPTNVIVAAARDVIRDYDLERMRLQAMDRT